jgi:hypothetical protein
MDVSPIGAVGQFNPYDPPTLVATGAMSAVLAGTNPLAMLPIVAVMAGAAAQEEQLIRDVPAIGTNVDTLV